MKQSHKVIVFSNIRYKAFRPLHIFDAGGQGRVAPGLPTVMIISLLSNTLQSIKVVIRCVSLFTALISAHCNLQSLVHSNLKVPRVNAIPRY